MNIKIIVKKNELIYFAAFILWTAWYVISQSSLYGELILGGNSRYIVEGICALMLSYKMIYCDKYKVKELDIISIVTIVTAFSAIVSGNEMIVMILLFIVASKNIPFKKIVKVSLIEISFLVLITVISCELGVLENYVYLRKDGTVRYGLGFKYTLFLGAYYLNIVLMYIYLKNKNIKYYEYAVILIVNLYIYNATDNRTVYMLIYLSVIFTILFTKTKILDRLNWVVRQVFSYCMPFCALISIVLSIYYDRSKYWFAQINIALEGRLSLGKGAIADYGFHLFGNKIEMIGNGGSNYQSGNFSKIDYNYIDNSYLQVALKYGIIFFIVLCVAYTLICIKEAKEKNFILCLCILVMAFQGIINDQFLLPPYNTFILIMGGLFTKTKNFNGSAKLLNEKRFSIKACVNNLKNRRGKILNE